MGRVAILLGLCSAGFAAMALLGRVDPAVALALEPLAEERDAGRRRWADALHRLGRMRLARGSRAVLARRLELAGSRWPIDAVLGLKVALPLCTVVLCLTLAPLVPMAPLVSLPIAAVAFRGPDLVAARLAKRREAKIAAQVLDLGELLLATTQAGLTPPMAFRRSAEALGGPLGEELARALSQIDLGVSWRAAIEQVVSHLAAPSLRRVLASLSRTQRLGTSVTGALRTV